MSKTILISVFLLLIFAFSGCKSKSEEGKIDDSTSTKYITTGSVERLNPKMDEIIDPGVLPEIIADSFAWSEGPVWIPEIESVLFSDIPHNSIFQWNEKDGLKLYLKPSGHTGAKPYVGEPGSNGLILDSKGRLVLCQHGDHRMARMEAPLDRPAPTFTTLADNWNGKRFNSPNDAVISKSGDLYFTDPAYGMEFKWEDPKREIDFAGLFWRKPDGSVSMLLDSIPAPNGVGLSPDNTKLYLASSGKDGSIYEYSFAEDGSLKDGKRFFDARELRKTRRGAPDGMAVRDDGIIFATGPGGVLVLNPDGTLLGSVLTGQATSNCTLDSEGSWLYMTADMYLMRIKLK